MRYNRMHTEGSTACVALSSVIGAARRNPLSQNCVETNQDLDAVKFDDVEANILKYYYAHVSHLFEEGSRLFYAMDIPDVLDKAFEFGMAQYTCLFGKVSLVYRRFTSARRWRTAYMRARHMPRPQQT